MGARLLLAVVAGLLPVAQDTFEGAAKKDLAKLQGAWVLVSAKQDGKALPDEKVRRTTLIFTGERFRFPGSAEQATSKEGTVKLDATRKPKHMDATSDKGEVTVGIYEVEGDRYRVRFVPPGKPRPGAFASEPGSGYLLQVWERKRAR